MGVLDQRFEKNFMITSVTTFQLGAEERHLAANVWAGVLRDRDDRFDDLAVRYGQV